MSVIIDGRTYFRTTEVCEKVGVSRSTLLRWLGNGVLSDAQHRDRRDWRLFTEDDIKRIKAEANKVK
jgi:excisionase family DNA binding protein